MARLPRHGSKMNKVKIGTTIEVDTKAALDGLMQAAPDSLRTPGEAIDYIANIAMGLQPRVAKTVDTACMEQIRIIEKEMNLLPQVGSREMMWSDLEASRSQLKRLTSISPPFMSRTVHRTSLGVLSLVTMPMP